MRELCTYIGTDAQAQQGLDENPQVQAAVEQVAQAAGSRNRQDDHHAGPDSVEQGNAEDDHQGQLDEGRGTDAKGTGQKADDEAGNDAVDIELLSRQGCRPHGKVPGQPGVLVEADIENQAGSDEHERRHRRQQLRRHDVGHIGAGNRADHTASADDGPRLHIDFMFPVMTDRPRNHGKSHGRQGNGQGRMDRNTETDRQQRNRDAGAASTDKADDGT